MMFRTLALFLFLVVSASSLLAADDPNIPKATKQSVLGAMTTYIDQTKAHNQDLFPIFDHTRRAITGLTFAKLHQGVVKKGTGKGQLFVACADFKDQAGKLIDVDFFVNDRFEVVEAIVHKKAGEKFAYSVD